jgi:hypothetical protein
MSSVRKQDPVSLCLFTFTDGRRCHAPAPILTSASTTPAKSLRLKPPKSSVTICIISSQEITSPPATSARRSDAFSPP